MDTWSKNLRSPGGLFNFDPFFNSAEESKRIFDQSKVPTVLATLGAGGLAGCFALGGDAGGLFFGLEVKVDPG